MSTIQNIQSFETNNVTLDHPLSRIMEEVVGRIIEAAAIGNDIMMKT